LGAGISSSDGLGISSHFDSNINANMAHAVSSIVYNHTRDLSERLDLNGYDHNLTFTKDGIIAL
jgi:predicted regulator of Ras-like GTPase activity (Roadblock/LC7/MglB family)